MEFWSVHHLYQQAEQKLGSSLAHLLQAYATNLKSQNLPVIFSLGHLSRITDIDYQYLHATVSRRNESNNYSLFEIRKRSGGKRYIHTVNGKLFRLHKFVSREILQKVKPHQSSFAFHSSGGIRKCAAMHCGSKWILQFDLKNFFYSISEQEVYQVFKQLGYKSLLAFELARLCTTTRLPKEYWEYTGNKQTINPYTGDKRLPYPLNDYIGVLPQGAPPSPMLSNIVATKLDQALYDYSLENGFVYTRYADDLTFSASVLPSSKSIGKIQREILYLIRKNNFQENEAKRRVAGPGSKKIVLGLLVDGNIPRLSKETYKRIERLIYASNKFGLRDTAFHEGFDSAYGFYNHLSGLMSFVRDVDIGKYEALKKDFKKILPLL
jgi:RNA-directed DNA polymerase